MQTSKTNELPVNQHFDVVLEKLLFYWVVLILRRLDKTLIWSAGAYHSLLLTGIHLIWVKVYIMCRPHTHNTHNIKIILLQHILLESTINFAYSLSFITIWYVLELTLNGMWMAFDKSGKSSIISYCITWSASEKEFKLLFSDLTAIITTGSAEWVPYNFNLSIWLSFCR